MSPKQLAELRRVVEERSKDAPEGSHWDTCFLDPAHKECAIHALLHHIDLCGRELRHNYGTIAGLQSELKRRNFSQKKLRKQRDD